MVDMYFDDAGIAGGILMLSERGEFMPRFQEGGVVNVRTEPIDSRLALVNLTPEEFRS